MIPKKLFSLLSIFNKFFKLSIGISCFRVLFGCNNTFEHPAYLNSGKNDVDAYIYLVLWEIIGLNHKKFQNLNINNHIFAYLMELEGISTVDLYTKIILNIRLRHYKNISK